MSGGWVARAWEARRRWRRHLARLPGRTIAGLALVVVVLMGSTRTGRQVEPDEVADLPATATTSAPPIPTTATAVVTTIAPTTTVRDPELGNGETVLLAFAGDTNFEASTARLLAEDPAAVFAPVADVLRNADLAMVNMETAIGSSGTPAVKEFVFQAPPEALEAYRLAGIDVVSAANNHGLDYGFESLDQTLAASREFGLPVIGIGLDEDQAYTPFETEIRGQRIAVIAATQVLDGNLVGSWTAGPDEPGLASAKRVDRLVEEVAAARRRSDTVVVFLHWGVELQECPTENQRELAAQLAEAGADVIVGTHAHRVQGGGMLGEAVVHYGLGNFSFFAAGGPGSRSGVFVVAITGHRVEEYRWLPARIVDRQPQLLEGDEREAAISWWESQRECTDLSR